MTTMISTELYTPKQHKSAERVLDSLDHLNDRLDKHYQSQRNHERKLLRSVAIIKIPNADVAGEFHEFRVMTHNISAGGMCFICPGLITEKKIFVGLLTSQGTASLWFNSEIMRCKEIQEEGFWEYGVAFRGRIEL
jgi:hypothetical protein